MKQILVNTRYESLTNLLSFKENGGDGWWWSEICRFQGEPDAGVVFLNQSEAELRGVVAFGV